MTARAGPASSSTGRLLSGTRPQLPWWSRAGPAAATTDGHEAAEAPVQADALLARLTGLAPGDARRVALRARVIEAYLPIALCLARRFAGRGEPQADLAQVAVIGLIKAVDRFTPARGVPFAGYAVPTIVGELKRHFRDTAWNIRVPRRLQELRLRLGSVTEDLAQALHRAPTTVELAARLGVSQRDVLQAEGCATMYRPISLQQPTSGRERPYLVDGIAVIDHGLDAVDNHETLRVLLADLPAREQLIIQLRFDADMTQAQIATEVGMSQMHVSRLLARTLTQLRDGMLADTTAAALVPDHHTGRSYPPLVTDRQTAGRAPRAAPASAVNVFSPGG